MCESACTVVGTTGRTLLLLALLLLNFTHTCPLRAVSCVAEDDGLEGLPVRVGYWAVVRRFRGSWDLSFGKQRDGLPNPSVGGDGLGSMPESTPRLWSKHRIHAGLACESYFQYVYRQTSLERRGQVAK